jgi:hypothetical protein
VISLIGRFLLTLAWDGPAPAEDDGEVDMAERPCGVKGYEHALSTSQRAGRGSDAARRTLVEWSTLLRRPGPCSRRERDVTSRAEADRSEGERVSSQRGDETKRWERMDQKARICLYPSWPGSKQGRVRGETEVN